MQDTKPCVRVVDDDAAVLASLGRLLRSAGFSVRTFSSSRDFVHERDGDVPGCVLLDMSMPGADSLKPKHPVIFMSGHGDIPLKAGAIAYLAKPFDQEQLLAAVRAAIASDRSARIWPPTT